MRAIMKTRRLCCLLILLCRHAAAQRPGDFVGQQKKRIGYMAAQDASLRTYETLVREAYDLTVEGMTTVTRIRQATVALRAQDYGDLLSPGAVVRRDSRIAGTRRLRAALAQAYPVYEKAARENGAGKPPFDAFAASVFRHVNAHTDETYTAVDALIEEDALQATTAERLRFLGGAYHTLESAYRFSRQFGNEWVCIAAAGAAGRREASLLEAWYPKK